MRRSAAIGIADDPRSSSRFGPAGSGTSTDGWRSALWAGVNTAPSAPAGSSIDGAGKTLMPGLIDAHFHTAFASLPQLALMTADVGYIALAAAVSARDTPLRGCTSVRDAGEVLRAVREQLMLVRRRSR